MCVHFLAPPSLSLSIYIYVYIYIYIHIYIQFSTELQLGSKFLILSFRRVLYVICFLLGKRCILITSIEMGVSTSADPGSLCYTNSTKGDSHPVHYNDPTRTRTYIPAPLPQPAVHLPTHIRSLAFHWLLHQPARTLSGINTPHIPSPVILHPPAYEYGTDRGFRNVGYYNSDAGELPKRKHITTCRVLLQ